jgi:hypothetical protein
MSQDLPVPGPGSGSTEPWNPDQQSETLEPVEPLAPLEPFSAGYTGTQFSVSPPSDEQQSDETGATGSGEQAFSSTPTSEAELPPEAQGEVNGGPLGCCLGVTVGVILSLTLAVFGRLYLANPVAAILHNPLLVLILLRVAMALLTLAAAILCGYFGWKLGKRFFREYEPPVVPVRERRPKRRRPKTGTRPREA